MILFDTKRFFQFIHLSTVTSHIMSSSEEKQKKEQVKERADVESEESLTDSSSEQEKQRSESSKEEKKAVSKSDDSDEESSLEEVVVAKKAPTKEEKVESPRKEVKEVKADQDPPKPNVEPVKPKEEKKPEVKEEKKPEESTSPKPRSDSLKKSGDKDKKKATNNATSAAKGDGHKDGGSLYFLAVEVKNVSKKPKNYYVHAYLDEEVVHKSSVTKKAMKWDDNGNLISLEREKHPESVRVRLFEKGLVGNVLDKAVGEARFKVSDFKDEYPYDQWYPLHTYTSKGEIKKQKGEIKLQILYFPKDAKHTGEEFHFPLHYLLKKDRLDLFERKLAELGDVSQQDHNQMTALLESVAMDKPDFLRAILKEHKGKVNEQKNSKGLTALHLACEKGPHCVDLLLEAGAKVDVADNTENKHTPFHYAAASNNDKAIESLLKHKADVNIANGAGDTPAHVALASGSVAAIKTLIKHKCDIYRKNNKNTTVWELSQRKEIVSKDARVTFMTELDVVDPREFKLMRKFENKIRVFGKSLSVDWRKGTQYTLTVKEKTNVAILLFYSDVDIRVVDFATKVGFCVVKGDEGLHKEVTFWQGGIGFGGLKPYKGELEPGTNYTIVPYAKAEEVEGDFQVIVFSDKKTVEAKELKPWKHETGVFGEWIGKTAGGSQGGNEPGSPLTWKNNVFYEVALPKAEKCHFCVFLSQEKDATPRLLGAADYKIVPYNIHIGFYLYDRTVSKLIDQTDKWLNSRDIYKHFTLDTTQRNHIVIIPTTFKAGQEANFRLQVYCDEGPVSIVEKS